MLILFNTISVRLSANMKMMMMDLNKSHVFVFNVANIVILFLTTQLIFAFFFDKFHFYQILVNCLKLNTYCFFLKPTVALKNLNYIC